MMVWPEEETWWPSRAPKFVRMDPLPWESEEEILAEADGNYVKADIKDPTPKRVKELRQLLESHGARGVVLRQLVETETVRDGGAIVTAMDSLEASIGKFANKKFDDEVSERCLSIFKEVTSA